MASAKPVNTYIKPRKAKAASHSAQRWEEVKPHITKLYRDDDRTLKDTMRMMVEVHGFRATKKQYKTRLTQWSVGKYNHDQELLHLLRKARQAESSGQMVSFRIRGKVTPLDEAKRHLSRKLVAADNIPDHKLPRSPTPSILSMQLEDSPKPSAQLLPTLNLGGDLFDAPIVTTQQCLVSDFEQDGKYSSQSAVERPAADVFLPEYEECSPALDDLAIQPGEVGLYSEQSMKGQSLHSQEMETGLVLSSGSWLDDFFNEYIVWEGVGDVDRMSDLAERSYFPGPGSHTIRFSRHLAIDPHGVWLRLDNLKQHIIRLHVEALTEKSQTMHTPYDPAIKGPIEVVSKTSNGTTSTFLALLIHLLINILLGTFTILLHRS